MKRSNQPVRSFLFSPRGRAVGLVALTAVVLWVKPMGLLLWARLRILANIPRTAIADEEALLAAQLNDDKARWEIPTDVVVLPRRPSRNPFADSSTEPSSSPHGADSPRNPTLNNVLDRSGRDGGGKSTGESAEETHAVGEACD